MSNKKNINNPKKVSIFLPKILKKINKNRGSNFLELKMNWDKIVGKEISKDCFVSSLIKRNQENVLTIISNKASILELSYSSEVIKKKINDFFLAKVVDVIKFKKSLQI